MTQPTRTELLTDEPTEQELFAAYWKDQKSANIYAHTPNDIRIGLLNVWNSALANRAPQSGAGKERLPADILAMCHKRGWSMHWTHRGAYLHLESSELIEAVRGKRGDPEQEAADVLLVLMSITENHGIAWSVVMENARAKCDLLMTKEHYKGEESRSRRLPT